MLAMMCKRLTLAQPRVVIDLFTSMLLNAYVLYKLHDATNHNKLRADYSSLDFIADWLQEVEPAIESPSDEDLADTDDSVPSTPPDLTYKQHRRKWWECENGINIRLDRRYHCLEDARSVYVKAVVEKNDSGEEIVKRVDLRRDCMYCGERNCYTFCQVCNVPLCLGDCCRKFHTIAKLPPLK